MRGVNRTAASIPNVPPRKSRFSSVSCSVTKEKRSPPAVAPSKPPRTVRRTRGSLNRYPLPLAWAPRGVEAPRTPMASTHTAPSRADRQPMPHLAEDVDSRDSVLPTNHLPVPLAPPAVPLRVGQPGISRAVERARQVPHEVVRALDPHGQPEQGIADPR